jgi:hypothetical protein
MLSQERTQIASQNFSNSVPDLMSCRAVSKRLLYAAFFRLVAFRTMSNASLEPQCPKTLNFFPYC